MLTIGITICDKDYHNLDLLLPQIEEKVKCEHEVIIVDNREEFLDEKTDWLPTFQFGYNAYQFASRAKIIELAKGDFIWFIDGDDEIGEIKSCDYEEDIIIFSYNTYPDGSYYYDECVKDKDLVTYDVLSEIRPVLWNKFIKKELFTKEFIDKYGTKAIVHNEDTMWLYEALIHAKTLREERTLIYFHKEGYSNKIGKFTCEDLLHLTVGFEESQKIISEFFTPEISSFVLKHTYAYLSNFVPRTEDVVYATNLLMDLIPKDDFREVLQSNIYSRCQSKSQMQEIIETVKKRYGEEYPYKESVCKVTYEDGREEDYRFVQTIDFEEDTRKKAGGKWEHNLSIICVVYDGNKKYLAQCTQMIVDNVLVDYEVVIVDNRSDKSDKLNYIGEATVVEADGNVGTLDGRRLGFEASKNDYIWFVDIDDYILPVLDADYGSNDVLAFPFFYNGEHTYGGKRIIPDTQFFDGQLGRLLNVLLWNKWFKREILERAYQDIPHFFCIYNEDNIVTFTALKYSKYVEVFDGEPIYTHSINDDSTTTKKVKDEKAVDIMFAGFDEATQYFKDNFEFCKELTYESPFNIQFYLDIMDKADDCVLSYFAQKLISLFGKEKIAETISLGKEINKLRYNRIKGYFDYKEK